MPLPRPFSFSSTHHSLGFTLIELLVVIAIIGLLASVVMASLNTARAKGRDAKRLAEMNTLANALALYYDDHGYYPAVAESGDGSLAGWKVSYLPNFLAPLRPYLPTVPVDPINSGPPSSMFNPRPDGTFFYMYYNYGSGTAYGCPWSSAFSVIGFRAAEGVDKTKFPKAQCGPMPCTGGSNPGINMPTCRDWSSEFDYSTFVVP